MWKDNLINANPATIMQRLYQLKAEQDGLDVKIKAVAVPKDSATLNAATNESEAKGA